MGIFEFFKFNFFKKNKFFAFVENFTQTTIEERELVVWGTAIGFLSFILSIIISIVREIKQKALKQVD